MCTPVLQLNGDSILTPAEVESLLAVTSERSVGAVDSSVTGVLHWVSCAKLHAPFSSTDRAFGVEMSCARGVDVGRLGGSGSVPLTNRCDRLSWVDWSSTSPTSSVTSRLSPSPCVWLCAVCNVCCNLSAKHFNAWPRLRAGLGVRGIAHECTGDADTVELQAPGGVSGGGQNALELTECCADEGQVRVSLFQLQLQIFARSAVVASLKTVNTCQPQCFRFQN